LKNYKPDVDESRSTKTLGRFVWKRPFMENDQTPGSDIQLVSIKYHLWTTVALFDREDWKHVRAIST
ncbi:hypothetical protein V5O48_008066, partial [Marasmius crinis-equi]